MTKELLISQIEEEIARLESIEYDNSIVEFALEYFKHNPYFSYESLYDVDITGACIIYLWYHTNLDEGLVQDAILRVTPVFEQIPANKIRDVMTALAGIVLDNEDILVNVDLDHKTEEENRSYLSLLDARITMAYGLGNVLDVAPSYSYNFLVCLYQLISIKEHMLEADEKGLITDLEEIKNNSDIIGSTAAFVSKMHAYKEYYDDCQRQSEEAVDEILSEQFLTPEQKKKADSTARKVVKETLLKFEYLKDIKAFLDSINNKTQSLNQKYVTRVRQKTKAINSYNGLIADLKALDEDRECTSYESLVSKAKDEKIKKQVLEYIYGLNMRHYEPLEASYTALEQDKKHDYERIFAKHGIEVPFAYLLTLTSTPSEINSSLTSLRKMQITDSDMILEILSKATSDSISHLENLYERKIIDSSFLITYPIVFDSESSAYINVFKNVNAFVSAGLNPLYLNSSPKTLLGDSTTIKASIDSLKSRDLLSAIDRNTNVGFLTNSSLNELIEKVSNLGHAKDLEEDINLLNIPAKRWDRVALLNATGQEVDSESLSEVLTNPTFIVPDAKLPEYLEALNATPKESVSTGNKELLKTELV